MAHELQNSLSSNVSEKLMNIHVFSKEQDGHFIILIQPDAATGNCFQCSFLNLGLLLYTTLFHD